MDVKKICTELLTLVINEFNDDENMDKIKTHILNPSLNYLVGKFYPYVIGTYIIFILIFVLCITSLAILLHK